MQARNKQKRSKHCNKQNNETKQKGTALVKRTLDIIPSLEALQKQITGAKDFLEQIDNGGFETLVAAELVALPLLDAFTNHEEATQMLLLLTTN